MDQAAVESMADRPLAVRTCKDCGYCPVFGERCPVCRAEVVSKPGPSFTMEPRNPHTYSLATLFLVMTVICVGLGAILAAPGIGVPLVVVSVPALVRTRRAAHLAARSARTWSTGERIAHFSGSLGLMFVIGVAGFIAFQIACWTSCLGAAVVVGENEAAFLTGIWVGGALGAWTIGWLLWKTWPRVGR